MADPQSQHATGGVFNRLVRSLSNPQSTKAAQPRMAPVNAPPEESGSHWHKDVITSGFDGSSNFTGNQSTEEAKSAEKNQTPDIEAVEQRGQKLGAIALIKNFVHIAPRKVVSVDSIQNESAAQPSTEELPVCSPVVNGDSTANHAAKPNALTRMKGLVHTGVKKNTQEMVDVAAPTAEVKAADPIPEPNPSVAKDAIVTQDNRAPTVDDAAVKAGVFSALARVKGLVHAGAKKPVLERQDKATYYEPESTIHNDVPAQENGAIQPIAPKPNVLDRVKSLVHIGGNKSDGEPKLVHSPEDPVDETVAAAIALVKEPEELQPRSITPSQFAELVDASIAESAAPHSPAVSIPSIEAVLSSASASAKDVDISSPVLAETATALVVPPARELAQTIFDLTSALPAPKDVPEKVKVSSPKKAKDGKPIPPAGAFELIKDEQLAQYLRTPKIMNGSTTEGEIDEELGIRKSVWDALDALPAPGTTPELGPLDAEDDDAEIQIVEDGSVMLYFPLVPKKDSEVKVADFVLVPVPDVLDTDEQDKEAFSGHILPSGATASAWPWPFPRWGGGGTDPGPSPPEECEPPKGGDESAKKPNKLKKKKPVQRKVWVPSQTELSVQASWWGFRIFLPPPILVILSAKSAEISKIATLITTALTWLSTNIPVGSLPAPLQPVVLLLTRIIPFIGYIGAFIAWSISSIRSFDKGNGVKLTATWLLPIALIPGAMDPVPTPADNPVDNPPPAQPSGEDQKPEPAGPPSADPVLPGTSPTPSAPETEIPTPSAPGPSPDGKPPLASSPTETTPGSGTSPPAATVPGHDEPKAKHKSKWFGGFF